MRSMNEMNDVHTKLEVARAELLDLGLRNNALINYQLSRARGVEVIGKYPEDIYRVLIQDGKSMSFLPKPEANSQLQIVEDVEDEANSEQQADNKLQTTYLSRELQRRLLSTYYAARTAIEEQGVNTLYLALGMLQWYEAESSDIPRQAPLILIPVELNRASIRAQFRIYYTGEDIGTNLSLQEKLKSDFGIPFPPIPEADDPDEFDIQNYCQEAEAAISSQSRWAIDKSAIAIGFFTFAKFLMYRDLNAANWPEETAPPKHSILQSILDEAGFQVSDSVLSDDACIDEHLQPTETHYVVDADSSQALAIHDVSQGHNLVIQGPPGTGKSQTITNLIAEAIASDKRVLFVAEKMAALEVVKRNLDVVGLGNTCLELHSHKINKKIVLEELKRTLELEPPQRKSEQELAQLVDKRNTLNDFCEAVNTPIGQNGVTPYQAYGEILAIKRRLSLVEHPPLDLLQFQISKSEFASTLEIVEDLQIILKRMGVPKDHPFWGSQYKQFPDEDGVKRLAAEALNAVTNVRHSSGELAQHLNFPLPEDCAEVERTLLAAQYALKSRNLIPDLINVAVKATEWVTQGETLMEGLRAGKSSTSIRKEHNDILYPEAWKENVDDIGKVITDYGGKWWRFFSGRYRQARSKLADLCKQLPKTQVARLRIIDVILEVQREKPRLDVIQELGKRLFGTLWGEKSKDWNRLQDITRYLSELHRKVRSEQLPIVLVDYLAADPDLGTLQSLVANVENAQAHHLRAIKSLIDKIELDENVRFGKGQRLIERAFTDQLCIFECWKCKTENLHDIVSYNRRLEEIRQTGFAEVIKVADHWSEASLFLSDIFTLSWYEAQLKIAFEGRPVLTGFDGDIHQQTISSFCELDRLSLECNKAKVAYKHWAHLRQFQSFSGQLGLLKREFAKKKKHLPIRQLMDRAGNAIQAIKPVFMMSPLSVAKFLPPESVNFDWVIFDEASQVEPVDAFGAIIRGKHTIVVGDDKQLPPSNFFQKIGDNDGTEEDEENFAGNTTSILELFVAQRAPQRMLRWHYRSRHESLIVVSNSKFYENKLFLFPSPDCEQKELGLVYHHCTDTIYDRGGSGKNLKEAEIVAAKVMEHALSYPDLTLGVGTFNLSQMQAILDQVEILRKQNPSCENSFFKAHSEEPFFVKNLENIQGDERDVIFISIGYGRDANGRLTMNFGPLNHDGGQKRLNVLITRARRRCEVFTTLAADDIDTGIANPGVEALQCYLKYAETGNLDVPKSEGDAESPFENEVANALCERGFEVVHQIGTAGYRIDLGIVDPERPGRFLLGIECDGSTYHRSQSARDRDRLRQQVLEGLGWRIHRIWSTDWFRTPGRERDKAIKEIERAKALGPSLPDKVPETAPDPDVIVPPPLEPQENSLTEEYELAELGIINGSDLHTVPPSVMADWIQRVVEVESPVHFDEVARRVTNAAGVNRIGNRIRHALETAARRAARRGKIRIKGRFSYWTQQQCVTVRGRGALPPSSRKLEFIAPEEIELAVKAVVSDSLGIERDDLPREVSRLFGFKSLSEDMRHTIELVADSLIKRGELTVKGNSLVLTTLDNQALENRNPTC